MNNCLAYFIAGRMIFPGVENHAACVTPAPKQARQWFTQYSI